jgi:hypothetical protein
LSGISGSDLAKNDHRFKTILKIGIAKCSDQELSADSLATTHEPGRRIYADIDVLLGVLHTLDERSG